MKKKSKRSNTRAIQTSHHWRLSHRKHSGRVLPRTSTSYPILAMIVLCLGVLLISWTSIVTASDGGNYDVSARVQGVAPTTPATIDTPSVNAIFTSKPVTVSGTCPMDTYIEVFRNDFSSGIALCDVSGRYSLDIDLFEGSNILKAKVYNLADLQGPDSLEVEVFYNSSSKSGAQSLSSQGSASYGSSSNPKLPPGMLLLKTNFKFRGYYSGEWVKWDVEVSGGTAPYAVSVDWGDGTSDLYSRKQDGVMTIQHRYSKEGGYKGNYVIKISASSNDDSRAYLQTISIVNNPNEKGSAYGGLSGSNEGFGGLVGNLSSDQLNNLIKYAWPSYGVVLLMLLSFWLGERREYGLLRVQTRKTKRS